MLLKIMGFDGLQPGIDARLLGDSKATAAIDTKLVNGTLRAWKEPKFVMTLPKTGNILSIYRWGQTVTNESSYWLHWLTDVDAVRGPIADEATERTYWTGDDPYPKYSYSPLILNGGDNYPQGSHRLGVPKPAPPPSVTAGALPDQDTVDTSRPVDVMSIEAQSSTVALVTLAEASTFDRDVATKIIVSGATPTQFNGNFDATWVDDLHLTYQVTNPDKPSTSVVSKALAVQAISRFDANTVQIALTEDSDFLTDSSHPATVNVSGCNVAQYNGTFPVDWVEEATVFQYTPTRPNVVNNYEMTPVDPAIIVGRQSAYLGVLTLTGGTTYDHEQSITVTIQHVVTPAFLNGTFTGTWVDENIIHFEVSSEIPDAPVEGPSSAPYITVTLNGPTILTLPDTPAPTLSACTIKGTISNELAVGEEVEGVSQVYLSGKATPEDNRDREARNYVVTFVTPLGEEGPPSDPTEVVEVVADQEVTLNSLPLPPSGEGWNLPASAKKRLYRSATSGTSAVYLFVVELDISVTTYTDATDPDDLAEALPSEDWTPPPVDLKGLCVLANTALAAFKNNEVWFSEPGLPHAWPSRNMVALDYAIVGIGAFGNSVLAGTTGTPYILSGADPAAMTPNKVGVQQACVSKRGVRAMAGGVIYPSPDGLCLADGNGVQVLTDKIMSRDEWSRYNPASIHAASHDFRYYAFFTREDGSKGTLVLDLSGAGAALWEMNVHYLAAHHDIMRDALYVVDTSRQLWRMYAGDSFVPFDWQSKVFDVPMPTNFGAAQVLADGYPITFKVWHGDTLDAVLAATPTSYTASSD